MKIEAINYTRPNAVLTLNWDETKALYHMIMASKNFSSDCGDNTLQHDYFLERLEHFFSRYPN